MDNKFNRQGKGFGAGRIAKTKVGKKSAKGKPSREDIELATMSFLKKGGEIVRFVENPALSKNEVFRANLEAESRLGMGTLVDDSWDCWENKDYDTNPSGKTL
jgi:hypothetical protein